MVVAPLVAGDEVFGALGTFSSRADAFSPRRSGWSGRWPTTPPRRWATPA